MVLLCKSKLLMLGQALPFRARIKHLLRTDREERSSTGVHSWKSEGFFQDLSDFAIRKYRIGLSLLGMIPAAGYPKGRLQ